MKRRLLIIAVLAVVVAACGGQAEDTTTSAVDTTAGDTSETTVATTVDTTAVPDTTAAPSSTESSGGGLSGDLAALQAALATSAEASPARVEGVMIFEGDGQTGEMPFTVITDIATGNAQITMDFGAMMAGMGGEEVPPEMAQMFGDMEMRQIDDIVYLMFPFFTGLMGAETEWVSMPAEEGSDFAEEMGSAAAPSNPASFLEAFAGAEGTVEELGTEDVRGISTTHYRVTVEEGWQAALSPEELAELEEQGPLPETSFPLDLWVDRDGLVQRMSISMTADEADVELGGETGAVTMMFDFFDFGQSVTIEPPPADQVTSMEELEQAFGMPPATSP